MGILKNYLIVVFLILIWINKTYSQLQLPPSQNTRTGSKIDKVWIDYALLLQQAKNSDRRSPLTFDMEILNVVYHFKASSNDLINPELQRLYPDIFTFDIQVEDQKNISGKMTLSKSGLYLNLLKEGSLITVFPANNPYDTKEHIIDSGQSSEPKLPLYCNSDHIPSQFDRPFFKKNIGARSDITIGERLYKYRMVVIVTGEYYQANGNNDNAVVTSVINAVNSLNALFGNEMSISFNLGNRLFLYKDPATDPFTPDLSGGEIRTSQAGKVISTLINSNDYDLGHVFHTHKKDDNWTTGGLAWIQSVCSNSNIGTQSIKASGWSGGYSNVGNNWINLLAHEIGHQFGATHTFNGSGVYCDPAIELGTAVEIGSGSTIMSYNGICDAPQNIPASGALDNYFHIISLEQMRHYVYDGQGGNCGGPILNPNQTPQVIANPCNATLIIPKNTPFYIKAAGTWNDNDHHTYCWEQTDEDGSGIKPSQGKIGNEAASLIKAPLFRSYPPSTDPFRYFPSLATLNSASGVSAFDVLPAVARELNFNVSIRDNHPFSGAIANDEVTIQVMDNGPLQVTRPSGGEKLMAGQSETITWNTNGSNALCSKARIKLSTDGGRTFPITIAENIPYESGVYHYAIQPNFVSTDNAKVIVECMDHDCFTFFDISDKVFSINSTCAPVESILCNTDSLVAERGSNVLNLNLPTITGTQLFVVSKTIKNSDAKGNVTVFTNDYQACKTVATSYYHQKIKLSVTSTGIYNFNIDGAGFVSIFSPAFDRNDGCNGFVASSARESTIANNVTLSKSFRASLRPCTEYEVVFYSFGTLPVTVTLVSENNPGIVFEPSTSIPNEYQHLFLLIDNDTGTIVKADKNTDLRSTLVGSYTLISAIIPSLTHPSSLINQNLKDVFQNTCINRVLNQKSIKILPSCELTNMTAGLQTDCVASTNRYTQTLTLSYNNPPATGKIKINNQEFEIESSPQTFTLVNLDSDGKPVNTTAFFTADEACSILKPNLFTAPVSCCPLSLELGPTIIRCQQSGTVKLEAGTDSTLQYKWTKDGNPINSTQGGVLFVTTSGLYGVLVTHPNGCTKTDTVSVIFNPIPQVTLRDNQQFCENDIFVLEASVTQGDTIAWFRNDTLISGATEKTLDVSRSGLYKIVVKNSYGCANQSQTIVQTITAPKVELGPDLAKCEGNNVLLTAGSDGIKYEWFRNNEAIPDANNKEYMVRNTGIYRVVVTNDNQCTTQDQVKIDYFAAPEIEDFPPTINGCQGSQVLLEAKVTNYQSLQWYYNNNPIAGANNQQLPVFNSGSYIVEVRNFVGCTSKKTANVQVRSLPVVNIGPDITLCERTPLLLFAGTEGILYQWSHNGIALNNPENTLSILESGLYKLSVTNSFNCTAIVQKNVTFVTGPTATISNDTSFCDGLTHTIKVTTNATNATFQWYRNSEEIPGSGPQLQVDMPGNYEAWITAGNPACTTIKNSTISVYPKPAVNLGNDRVLCDPSVFPVLNGGASNSKFQWSLNGTPLSTARTITADKTGIYALDVSNSFGCKRNEQVKITISSNPTLTLSLDTILCEGKILAITSQTNGTKFTWRKNNIVIPNATSNIYNANTEGKYTLMSANSDDCRTEKSITIYSKPNPTVSLGKDTSLCPGATLILHAGNQNSYFWSDGSSASTLHITAGSPITSTTSIYTVTVKNEFNCAAIDSILITNFGKITASILASKTVICQGDTMTLTASGGQKYKWTEEGNGSLSVVNQATTVAKPAQNTIYTVEVSNDLCPTLKDIKSVQVNIFEKSTVDAGQDTCTLEGRRIQLHASGGIKYQWENDQSFSGPNDIPNPFVNASETTLYKVSITDSNGCVYIDSVTVCIKSADVAAINVLTPNNDGKNDVLFFSGLELYPGNKLIIFNRWGNIIFEAEDYQINGILFNGERNGERIPPDTYYYILRYENKVIKSALTILWD